MDQTDHQGTIRLSGVASAANVIIEIRSEEKLSFIIKERKDMLNLFSSLGWFPTVTIILVAVIIVLAVFFSLSGSSATFLTTASVSLKNYGVQVVR
ncbi:hypothetical protein [Collimonas arenae]|uniref:hypothetical protein n=1 Tax=Collimonas arenae TaxID=279058 RepID=UPI001F3D6E99|nr:hypothetical protein [Collimonas arenae]